MFGVCLCSEVCVKCCMGHAGPLCWAARITLRQPGGNGCGNSRMPLLLQVDPRGKTWNRLRASIGQPNFIDVDAEEATGDKAEAVEVQKVPQMS